MERKFAFLTSQMMSPKGVSEQERQYWRGYFAGMKFLLDQPDLCQEKLDKAYEKSQTDER